MNRNIAIAAIATIGLFGITACNPVPQALRDVATAEVASDPAWSVDTTTDSLTLSTSGYPEGTLVELGTDGDANRVYTANQTVTIDKPVDRWTLLIWNGLDTLANACHAGEAYPSSCG